MVTIGTAVPCIRISDWNKLAFDNVKRRNYGFAKRATSETTVGENEGRLWFSNGISKLLRREFSLIPVESLPVPPPFPPRSKGMGAKTLSQVKGWRECKGK